VYYNNTGDITMRLLDKIALQRLISLILTFILSVLKLVIPKTIEDIDKPLDKRRKWFPNLRKKK
jgi:hypothetical protein